MLKVDAFKDMFLIFSEIEVRTLLVDRLNQKSGEAP